METFPISIESLSYSSVGIAQTCADILFNKASYEIIFDTAMQLRQVTDEQTPRRDINKLLLKITSQYYA